MPMLTKILLLCLLAGRYTGDITKDPNSSRYLAKVSPNDVPTDVSFGDPSHFTPKLRSSRWNNEAWLEISHNDRLLVTNEKEALTDGKLQLTVQNRTHRYYIDPNGNLEYEIEFGTKPDSNVVSLDLDFPEGLVFFYQDSLENEYLINNMGYSTLEEYLENHGRPDKVVGSYAVYWSKKGNRYKSGKFCHIYRPQIIDSDGKKQWCNLEVKGKSLSIGMPQKFLESARYPVILDPTIGYTSLGGSEATITDGLFVTRYACGTDGTTASATFYVGCEQSVEDEARGCVYADNSGTVASQAKLSSSEAEITNMNPDFGEAWRNASITPPAFSNGTDYWVGAHIHQSKVAYDAATPGYEDTEYQSLTYTPASNDLPANFSATPSSVAREYSFYIDYTEDTGGAATGAQVIIIN